MKTLIIDDDPASHSVLKRLLAVHSDIDLIDSSSESVQLGLTAIEEHQPDLILLDVEMPDGTGFDLLQACPDLSATVVFITAHNKYAQQAIRFGALDFLEKPIDEEDLAEALDRCRAAEANQQRLAQMEVVQEAYRQLLQQQLPTRLVIRNLEEVHFLDLTEIVRLRADSGYTEFYTQNRKQPVIGPYTLRSYMDQLGGNQMFFQTHRSHVVNLHFLQSLKRAESIVLLRDGTEVPIAKGKIEGLLGLM